MLKKIILMENLMHLNLVVELLLHNENLVLSIGDYRLRSLPQNKNFICKIIKFNLKEKNYTYKHGL